MSHPTPNSKTKKSLDYLIYFFSFTTPLFELPQAYIIYSQQSSEGVSLTTWAYFVITSIVWLAYGIQHKIKPIIVAYTSYLAVELLIVVGILLYS